METTGNKHDRATAFFLKNCNYVRKVAFLNAPRRDLVDDIVNDTFVLFLEKGEELDFDRNLLALLAKITEHVALRYWHEYVHRQPGESAELCNWIRQKTQAALVESENDLEEEIDAMMKCLDKLPKEHQTIMRLHYFKGVSFTEIAVMVKKKIKAVQKIASRLRIRLRACIDLTLRQRGDD